MKVYFWDPFSVPLPSIYIFYASTTAVSDYCGFLVCSETKKCETSSFVLLLYDFFFFFFAIWDPLKLHMNLSVGFLYQKRKNKLKLKLQYFVSWWEELTWKRPWYWERLKARERDDRGWGGWMASPTQWTWAWASPRSWWWTGRPGVLQSIGLQRVGHNWITEVNWTEVLTMVISFLSFPWAYGH